MRSEDFPHPANDNRRGMFWSPASMYPAGEALDFWLGELQAMQIKWVKLLDDRLASSLPVCQRLVAAGMVPIVRLAEAPEASFESFTPSERDALRRLIDAGVRYFETDNEPDLRLARRVPRSADWLGMAIDRFVLDAEVVLSLGGLPGLPALSFANAADPVQKLLDRGRADLFGAGVWVPVHSYTGNRPLEFPFDPVNTQGQPVTVEEYDLLGSWAWQERPRDVINEWRAKDRQGQPDIASAGPCFMAWRTLDEHLQSALGYPVPIIATEGGPVVGWQDDRRYPRVTPEMHASIVTQIDGYLRGDQALAGESCPSHFMALCHSVLANERLGTPVAGWEPAAWYTGYWQSELGLDELLPAVAVLKSGQNPTQVQVVPATAAAATAVALATAAATGTGSAGGAEGTDQPGDTESSVLPTLAAATAALAVAAAAARDPEAASRDAPAGSPESSGAAPTSEVAAQSHSDGAISPAPVAAAATLALAAAEPGAGDLPESDPAVAEDASSTLAASEPGAGGLSESAPPTAAAATLALAEPEADAGNLPESAQPAAAATLAPAASEPGAGGLSESAPPAAAAATLAPATSEPGAGALPESAAPAGATATPAPPAVPPVGPVLPATVVAKALAEGAQGQSALGGKVLDWAGSPVSGVVVTLRRGESNVQAATGGDGTFRFLGLPAGSYDVTVRNVTVAGITLDGTVKRGIKLTLGAADQGAGQVSGQVPGDQTGRAVILSGLGSTQQSALNVDGVFNFNGVPPGRYYLALAGLGTVHDNVVVEPGGLFSLVLPLTGRITGQVIDPEPMSKAVLYSPPGWGWTRQCPLDFGGAFAFNALPPGRYQLRVGGHVVPGLVVTDDNTVIVPPLDLNAGHSLLSGCVTDGSGQPCAGTPVVLHRDEVFLARMQTSAHGVYEFRHLPPGNYTVTPEGAGAARAALRLDGQELAARDLRIETAPRQARSPVIPVAAAIAALGSVNAQPAGVAPVERAYKLIAHYLLFGSAVPGVTPNEAEQAVTRLTLCLATEYLRRVGATGGFSLDEARRAAKVTILGDLVSSEAEAALCAAGCQVARIPGDPNTLAQSLAQLVASLGEG